MTALHMHPPISICIAARNEQNTISKAIETVIDQHYEGQFEILIGINASSDRTEEIVRHKASNDSRIRLILTPPGKAATWNALFNNARHDMLVFVDGDVMLSRKCLKILISSLEDSSDVAVAGNNIIHVPTGVLSSFKRVWHYPYHDTRNIGLTGRLYALKKEQFRLTMHRRGFQSMPEDLLDEDHWIMLLLEERKQGKVTSKQWALCHDAIVYYQPASLIDEYRRTVRVFKGYLQIEREYPDLGFEFTTESLTVHASRHMPRTISQLAKEKFTLIAELSTRWERLLFTLILIPRKIILAGMYRMAYNRAWRTYETINHVWDATPSTKKPWRILPSRDLKRQGHSSKILP